jgi:hypothetical protein
MCWAIVIGCEKLVIHYLVQLLHIGSIPHTDRGEVNLVRTGAAEARVLRK